MSSARDVHQQRRKWNRRHADAVTAGGAGPASLWLVEHHHVLAAQPRGRALDLACGLGRNALLLAELGFEVEAVDLSEVAIDWLAREADRRGLRVDARSVDLEDGFEPHGPYEVILMMNYLDRALLGGVSKWLAPGGLLAVEAFVRGPDGEMPGSMPPSFVLEPGELLRVAAEMTVIGYEAATLRRHERGDRWVTSLLARSPHVRTVGNVVEAA